MSSSEKKYRVNIFRPRSVGMKGEVVAIMTVLAVWVVTAFGFQLWLALSATSSGQSPLETFTFFNLPFHYWFTAQMLPLCFIIICALFNFFIDRLTLRKLRKSEGYND
jgi:putative solute:sodium symporter small subunit